MTEVDNTDAILALFDEQWAKEGKVELYEGDADGISEGEDNGAYVLAWVWVDFAGTDLDKDDDEAHELAHGDQT